MSLCARSSLIAFAICWNVTLVPGGPETGIRLFLSFAGDAEQPRIAARKATFAASKAVPSKPVYGFAPCTDLFQSAWNAVPAGPPAELAAVPLSPTTVLPVLSSVGASRSASVISVFEASHLPVRTSDGSNFRNVSGKSMITQPFGLPDTSCCASVSNVDWFGSQEMFTPTLPPSFVYSLTNSCLSALPNASLRAPTFRTAPLPKRWIAASASTLPCSVSEGYARHT